MSVHEHRCVWRATEHPVGPCQCECGAVREFDDAWQVPTFSCLICGTTTPLPHVCPAFYPDKMSTPLSVLPHDSKQQEK